MPRLLFGLVEVVMLVLFARSARFAYRTGGRQRLIELLSAVPFGLLLEQGDIKIFGSYAYSQGFFLKLGSVPVAIALAWAMIITSSMFMSDRLRIPARIAPFADAVFAILLDLSLDAIAIRQGLWHWNIPLNAGFFGVPAGNYYGWLFVAFGFSAWTRWLRGRIATGSISGWLQLLIPIPAYLTLLLALVPFILLQQLFFGGPTGGFPPFLFALAVFVLLTGRSIAVGQGGLGSPFAMPLLPRLLMHGYFITAGIALGIFQQFPVLLAMSLGMVVIELSLGPAAQRRLIRDRRSAA
jgi:uncharacterized membrane protein